GPQQRPTPDAEARREQSLLARATPATIRNGQSRHRGCRRLTMKIPHSRSEQQAEQSLLSEDRCASIRSFPAARRRQRSGILPDAYSLLLTAHLSGHQVMINGYAFLFTALLRSWLRSCRPGTAVHWGERPQRSQQLPQLAGPRAIKIPIPLAGPRSGIGLPGVLVAVLTGTTLLLVAA